MQAHSTLLSVLPEGVILDVTIEELTFRAYVVVSEPDIDQVARFVTPDDYALANDWHVTAVFSPEDAAEQVEDIAFNMSPNDAAVFLCADRTAQTATLHVLGQPVSDGL